MVLPMAGHSSASPCLSQNKLHPPQATDRSTLMQILAKVMSLPRLLWKPCHAGAEFFGERRFKHGNLKTSVRWLSNES